MNAERLMELYDRVSEAPDAIPRLRRFILDLAVRGKLVDQDPDDEPASKLLDRVLVEKASDRKRRKPLPEIDTTASENVPNGWCIVPLIALGTWAIGSGFPKNEQGRSEGPYFFLKVSDMNLLGNEKHIIIANNYIDDDAANRMRAAIHPPGTIIFPKIGGAIATNKRRILTRGSAIDNNCLGITFSPQLDLEWAYLLLTTMDFTKHQAGTAVPALQQGVLEEIPVALPPLLEQRRIVAKVDELMTLCDSMKAEREKREATRDRLTTASLSHLTAPDVDDRQFKAHAEFAIKVLPEMTTRPDQIKVLRQTILDLAVRGKLVEQDPNDEPANELLKKIKAAKEARVRSRAFPQVKPPVELMNPELELSIPAGWLWVRLGDVIKVWNGFAFKSSDFRTEGIPVIRIGDLQNGGVMLANAKRVSSDVARSVDSNFWIPEGSLLIAMSGATTGKTAINLNKEGLLLNQRVGRIESFGMNIRFVRVFFETIIARNLSIASGTAIPNLSTQQLNATAIPLPPLAEQKRIIAKVDELMALCDQLEQGLDLRRGTQSHLLEGLTNGALHSLITEAA